VLWNWLDVCQAFMTVGSGASVTVTLRYHIGEVTFCIGFTILVATFRTLRDFRFHPGLSIFTSTIEIALPDLLDTVTVMIYMIVCLAMVAHAIMGMYGGIKRYAQFQDTVHKMGELAFGMVDFDTFNGFKGEEFVGMGMPGPFKFLKYGLFWGTLLFLFIVLPNILIAVVSDAYEEARGERNDRMARSSFIWMFIKKLRIALGAVKANVHSAVTTRKAAAMSPELRREAFAHSKEGKALVAACVSPFSLKLMYRSVVFDGLWKQMEDKRRSLTFPEAASGDGDGAQKTQAEDFDALLGSTSMEQLEQIVEAALPDTDAGQRGKFCASLAELYGEPQETEQQRLARTMGTSSTERGCLRALRKLHIHKLEQETREVKQQVDEVKQQVGKVEQQVDEVKQQVDEVKGQIDEILALLRRS
jgi:hypothetical protein